MGWFICAFKEKWHSEKADGEIRLKRLFKRENLCYSVSEADRRFLRELTRVSSSRSNRRDEPHKQGFNSGWTDFATEELHADMYGIGERNFVRVFSFSFLDGYGLGNHLTEVVHGELCKDFLVNKVHLF